MSASAGSETSNENETTCAVIVTFNRRELLAESVAAVLGQTSPPESVLVVDNASDDGSREMLAERFPEVDIVTLQRNEGGAGGFHEGVKHAHARGYAHLWLMDDDTIPARTALAELLAAHQTSTDAALIASKVVWTDGRLHPMNRPFLAWNDTERMIAAAESASGLVPLRAATFVSLLLDCQTVDRHGLPEKRYFIWSDDISYTARVLREEPGFIATRSVAVHKTQTPHTAVTSSGDRFYFHVRNSIYMFRGNAWSGREKVSLVRYYVGSILEFLRRESYRRHALGVVARGLHDGLRPPGDPAGPYLRRS